jgi:hypothetical protein
MVVACFSPLNDTVLFGLYIFLSNSLSSANDNGDAHMQQQAVGINR